MEKLPSDSDSDSLENELGFANEMDFTNEISYANELNLDNNNLEQQELEKEQITSTTQAKSHDKKKASTYSKRQKRNIENSESETEASTSVVTTKSAKSSAMQHKLPGRKKGGSQLRSWVWNHFDRKTPPPDKAARGECQ
ncbi:hypothetical protein F8M41_010246 [Gigaspora margarita]|uniref:Uncharacterized protein n=1 Tax=Gigaspora margarita TaxID=4874 RepID=A0A8H4AUM6_GIGMA|nr:hypothetical protein F8M41_010246 [Gigaspora margarita]